MKLTIERWVDFVLLLVGMYCISLAWAADRNYTALKQEQGRLTQVIR
jgi:hypothetical protein